MMKAKRILLHLIIMALAAVCVFCSARAIDVKRELNENEEDIKYLYSENYNEDMSAVLNYAKTQKKYLENYRDPKKVIVEDKEFGNVTVEKLAEFYKLQRKAQDANNEYDAWSKTLPGIMDNVRAHLEDVQTVLDEGDDEGLDEQAKQDYAKERESLEKELRYYEKVEKAYNQFLSCVDVLRCDNDDVFIFTDRPLDLDELQKTFQEECKECSPGFFYCVQYKVGEKEYTVSNVNDFNRSDYDVEVHFEDGQFYVDGSSYDIYLWDNTEKETEITYAHFAICITEEVWNGYEQALNEYGMLEAQNAYVYAYCKDHIKNKLSETQIGKKKKEYLICICSGAISAVIAFALFILLVVTAGRKEKNGKVQTIAPDRWWIDVGAFVFAILYIVMPLFVLSKVFNAIGGGIRFYNIALASCYILGVSGALVITLFGESLSRRIKTKTLVDTTLIGRLCRLLKKEGKRFYAFFKVLMEDTNLLIKLVAVFVVGSLWNCIFYFILETFAATNHKYFYMIFVIGAYMAGVCYFLWKYFSENDGIIQGAKKISEGDLKYQIDEELTFSNNRVLAKQINQIGEGLSRAVEESVKNERMKTELITNVSHDLKTPLTSIINYIDLLKTEGMDSENATKYLEILEQKSQRLKNLTEDLVEASKLNSGVAIMELEKLDLVQLVNQSLAEYEERFAARNLQLIKSVQEEPMMVMADGRKTWRLLDNLYNNVSKYAMPGTRVYVDLYTENGKAVVAVKNISENALNINAEELMERFVRGEASRTTEGSGLGLSIAKSIAQRQSGDLEITLDGDLFKVTFEIDLYKE